MWVRMYMCEIDELVSIFPVEDLQHFYRYVSGEERTASDNTRSQVVPKQPPGTDRPGGCRTALNYSILVIESSELSASPFSLPVS